MVVLKNTFHVVHWKILAKNLCNKHNILTIINIIFRQFCLQLTETFVYLLLLLLCTLETTVIKGVYFKL